VGAQKNATTQSYATLAAKKGVKRSSNTGKRFEFQGRKTSAEPKAVVQEERFR